MFTLTIQVSSIDEAERILAALKHTADPAAVAQVEDQVFAGPSPSTLIENPEKNSPAIEQTPRRRGRPPKADQKSAAPVAESGSAAVAPALEEQPASEPVVQSAQQTLSIDDARNALKEVQAKYGAADMAKPLALLGQFGANRVSEVKVEKYAEFIAACKAA
jgi:predicted lipid-binding transport protein (Tim44 family)